MACEKIPTYSHIYPETFIVAIKAKTVPGQIRIKSGIFPILSLPLRPLSRFSWRRGKKGILLFCLLHEVLSGEPWFFSKSWELFLLSFKTPIVSLDGRKCFWKVDFYRSKSFCLGWTRRCEGMSGWKIFWTMHLKYAQKGNEL